MHIFSKCIPQIVDLLSPQIQEQVSAYENDCFVLSMC